MDKENFNYNDFIEDAMIYLIKNVLSEVEKNGLTAKSHFYISFLTRYSGVKLSENVKEKYPEQITIVLEKKFKI